MDSVGYVGGFTSLALDASAYAHISYRDTTNHDLKYATTRPPPNDAPVAADDGYSVDEDNTLNVAAPGVLENDSDADGDPLTAVLVSDVSKGTLTLNADGSFTYTLSVGFFGTDGFTYKANDGIADSNVAAVTITVNPTHELPATGYYMISFPLTPTLATPHDLLSDDLGDGNYYMWGWEAGGYQRIPTSLPESRATTLSAQQGYWVLAQAATLDMDVGGTVPTGDQSIPLQTGWNMVAAPYGATMDRLWVRLAGGQLYTLAEAASARWVLATFYYSHNGTGSYSTLTIGQTPADALSLWYGYWVLAGVDCSLIVPPPSGGAGGTAIRAAQPAQPQPTWAFDILATSGTSVDSLTIAAADEGSEGFDGFALDRPKPPAAPGEARVRMLLRGKGRRGTEPPPYNKAPGRQMPWSSELAMETKGTAEDAAEWDFTVTGGAEGDTVTLSWPDLSGLPKDRVAILTDEDTGKRTFMRSRGYYEFAAPGEGSSRSFAVSVKPTREAGMLISSFSVVPLRGGRGAEITFGLSADAIVDIDVLNVAGRLVQRVRDGLGTEAGRHTVTWRGRSLSDTALPNGLYLCVLNARAADGQQARAVRPLRAAR